MNNRWLELAGILTESKISEGTGTWEVRKPGSEYKYPSLDYNNGDVIVTWVDNSNVEDVLGEDWEEIWTDLSIPSAVVIDDGEAFGFSDFEAAFARAEEITGREIPISMKEIMGGSDSAEEDYVEDNHFSGEVTIRFDGISRMEADELGSYFSGIVSDEEVPDQFAETLQNALGNRGVDILISSVELMDMSFKNQE